MLLIVPVVAGVVPVHRSFGPTLPASIRRSLRVPNDTAFQAAPVRQAGAGLLRSFDLIREAVGTRGRRHGVGDLLGHRDRFPS